MCLKAAIPKTSTRNNSLSRTAQSISRNSMFRPRFPLLFLTILSLLSCSIIIFYVLYANLFSPGQQRPKQVVLTTPPTPALALFRRHEDKPDDTINVDSGAVSSSRRRGVVQTRREVELWGKASIAEYLWIHVLGGNTTTYANGLLGHGEMVLDDMHLRYRSGPGIIQNAVPNTVKNLVLIINGKDDLKVRFSRSWLDYLVHFRDLKHVAIVMLGNEQCDNDWLRSYLKENGGPVDLAFLVYDSPLIDDKHVFQWPLGVATYRGFPHFRSDKLNVKAKRQHLCNFYGTVYKNSSREELMRNLPTTTLCDVQTRDNWVPSETFNSMEKYLRTLTESDLTLSPVGKNTECYRIYEALALGSVPVVEDVLTPGRCVAPLRLLKRYNAPLLYVKSWSELPALLEAESKLSLIDRVKRRQVVVEWYEKFKLQLRDLFLNSLRKVFFKKGHE